MPAANAKKVASLNLLDRAIGYLNPAAGARRLTFRNYCQRMAEGANQSKSRQYRFGAPANANKEIPQHDRLTMVDRARYLGWNSGFIRGAMRDLKRYSVGPRGLYPESQSENEPWKKEIEDLYPQWCRTADATGRFHFGDLQRMAVECTGYDGDCGLVYIRDAKSLPKLQFIEGHLITDDGTMKESVDGVLLDAETFTPTGYRIRVKDDENGKRKSETVDAANFIHIFDPERYTGTRGFPWLAAAINNGLDIFDIVGYEKHFLHNASSKSLIETNDTGTADSAAEYLRARASTVNAGTDDQSVQEEKLESGTIVYHRAGAEHDLKAFQFDRPTAAFREFIDWLEGDIYLSLGLPVNWKNMHKEGGATLRAALMKSQRRFEEIKVIIENRLCFRVWNWLTFEAARLGKTRQRPPDWWKVVWYGPPKGTVDAGRDSKANIDDIKMGLRTYAEDYAERGESWSAGLRQVGREAAAITAQADAAKEPRENIVQRYPNPPNQVDPTVTPAPGQP